MSAYQPKTGAQCGCRRGVQRDNCQNCEGTGMVIDFKAIRACGGKAMTHTAKHTPGPWTADGANLLYAAPSEEDQFEVIEVNAPYNTQDRLLIASIPAGFADSAANAVLIAAAPAMYEALRLAVVMHPHNETFRQALAQAEGRQ